MPGVPGQRGHVPKRSTQRHRRSGPEVDRVAVSGRVPVPDLGVEDPHPLARDLYKSLSESGQSRWYEPSDWQRARIMCQVLSQQLKSGRPSSMMYTALQRDMDALLVSESERRRVRIEIERAQVEAEPNPIPAYLAEFAARRERLISND